MKYKKYEITIDHINSICKRANNGERRFVGGYLCRVFDKDDYFHEHLLDEFYITSDEISYDEDYDEVSKVIEYMDEKYKE
jgi:hypothetical protein